MLSEKGGVMIKKRPLSPHLSIYKPQISSVLSIMHRITGVLLFIFILNLSWLMIVLLSNSMGFKLLNWDFVYILNSCWFKCYLGCILFCLYFHLFNGIRHLFWDAGLGFKIVSMHKSGWLVILGTLLMTVFTVFLML